MNILKGRFVRQNGRLEFDLGGVAIAVNDGFGHALDRADGTEWQIGVRPAGVRLERSDTARPSQRPSSFRSPWAGTRSSKRAWPIRRSAVKVPGSSRSSPDAGLARHRPGSFPCVRRERHRERRSLCPLITNSRPWVAADRRDVARACIYGRSEAEARQYFRVQGFLTQSASPPAHG